MATGDRRMGPARRGMTVLGKIPAAPKPINLPSQRLENRGLDPNVEIVPRGTLSWGSTGRSPPTGGSPWGNTGLSSSPPVSTGAWNNAAKLQTGSVSGKGTGGVGENSTRPSSAGSGPRPSSAPLTTGGAWNTAAKVEEQLQPSRFALTPVDFPTLGSEKNPDLRPQQSSTSSGRPASADGSLLDKERRPLATQNQGQNFSALHYTTSSDSGRPASADGTLLDKERRPFTVHPGLDGYGRTGPGSGGYSRPVDGYGNYPPFMQQRVPPPGNRGFPLGPGMYPSPLQHGGYYGAPGAPQYGTAEDREMLMLGMVGNSGIYGHYHPHQGPPEHFTRPGMYGSYVTHTGPPDHFGRPSYGALGPGHRPPGMSTILTREQTEVVGYERDGHSGPGQEFGKHKDGWINGNSRDGVRLVRRESSDSGLPSSVSGIVSDVQKHTTRAILGRRQPGQSDWGAVSSGDEPMDFSKPAFKEEASPKVSVSEDTKATVLLKNRISQSQASRTELLSREGSKQQPTDRTNKPIEGSQGSEGGYTSGSLNTAASGVPVKVNTESAKDGKECEYHGDSMGESNEDGKIKELNPPKKTNEVVHVKVRVVKNMTAADVVENTSGKKESVLSQSLADNNRDKAVSPHAISFKEDNSLSRSATAVSHTKSAELEPETPGKSVVVGTESLSSPSCHGADSVVETSTTHDKLSTSISSRDKVNHSPSESECDKNNDKKGMNDGSSDGHLSTGLGDVVHSMEVPKNTAAEDLDLRVDHKPKVRMNSHEGEKEWRPKLLPVDRKPSLKPAGKSGPQSRKALGVSTSASGSESKNNLEKGTSEQDNIQAFDLYDYEGQRAKLRETAAQRAIQRQKEEEERLKEQKAKALAKLEELNRRTSVTVNNVDGSVSDESSKALSKAEPEVEQQTVAESLAQSEAVVSAPEGGGGSDNHAENPIKSLVAPADSAGNVTPSSGIHEGAAALRRKKNNRNGKGRHRMEGSSVATECSPLTEPTSSDLSSGDMSGDGRSHVKVSSGGIDSGEGLAQVVSSAVKDAPVQVSIHGFIVPDLGKDISFGSFHEDDYVELGLTKQIDESPSKTIQQKSQSLKQSSRDRLQQDVRIKDKQHTTEGMVWARVRSVESSVNIVSESSNNIGEKVEELRERGDGISSQSSARHRRDEIKRYNPKSAGTVWQSKAFADGTYREKEQQTVQTQQMPNRQHREKNFGGKESHVHDNVAKKSKPSSLGQQLKNQLCLEEGEHPNNQTQPMTEIHHRVQNIGGKEANLHDNLNKQQKSRVALGQQVKPAHLPLEDSSSGQTIFVPQQQSRSNHANRPSLERDYLKERQTVQTQQMPNQQHREKNFGGKESHVHDNVAKKSKLSSLGQQLKNQFCVEEGEHPNNQTQPVTDIHHRVQNIGGKEANLRDNSNKQQKSSVALGQQVKPAHLPLEDSSSVQTMSVPQQQSRSNHANRQGLERDYVKDLGVSASHHSKKHGWGHLEWQQAASSSNEKSMPAFGATGLSHNRKQQMSVSKTAESMPGEQTVLHSSRPVSAKSSSSGENQKINSQLHYQAVSQPSHGFKSFEQVEARPEVEPISRQPDRRDNSYTGVRDNWPLRRGRFNGRVRAADLERRGEYFPKQRLVIDATGGETPSPLVG